MSVLQNHALAVTELQRALDENERLRAELTKTLDNIAPAIESLACHQQQLDMEGVIVGVSRQAVHEVVEGVNAMACMLSPKKTAVIDDYGDVLAVFKPWGSTIE